MQKLVYSSILLTLIRGVGVVLQAANFIYLARTLSVVEFGVFATLYAILGLARALAPVGTDQVALRELAVSTGGGAIAIVRGCLTVTSCCAVAASLAIIVGGASGLIDLGIWPILAGALPLFACMGAMAGILRGAGYNVYAQLPEALLLQVVFGSAIWIVGQGATLSLYRTSVCLLISAASVVVVYAILYHKAGLPKLKGLDLRDGSTSFKAGFPVFRAVLFTNLSGRAPVLLASIFGGAPTAAVMDMALRFGSVTTLFTSSVAASFSPQFAALSRSGQHKALRRALTLGSGIAAMPAALWLLLLLAFGAEVTALFLPPEYSAAVNPMRVVALAYLVNAAFGLPSNCLFMVGQPRAVEAFSLAQLSILTLIAVLIVPSGGALVLAWAMVLGSVVRDCGSSFAIARWLRRSRIQTSF